MSAISVIRCFLYELTWMEINVLLFSSNKFMWEENVLLRQKTIETNKQDQFTCNHITRQLSIIFDTVEPNSRQSESASKHCGFFFVYNIDIFARIFICILYHILVDDILKKVWSAKKVSCYFVFRIKKIYLQNSK